MDTLSRPYGKIGDSFQEKKSVTNLYEYLINNAGNGKINKKTGYCYKNMIKNKISYR